MVGFLQQNNLTHKKDKSATNQPFSKGQMQNCFGAYKNFIDIDKKECDKFYALVQKSHFGKVEKLP